MQYYAGFSLGIDYVLFLQELKGNIRVFCRVRPFLSDADSNGQEEAIISYPSSVENAGRGIDLMNQGELCYSHFYADYTLIVSCVKSNETLCLWFCICRSEMFFFI